MTDLKAQLALVGWHGFVDGVDEQQIGLACLQAQIQDFLPDFACLNRAHDIIGLGADQVEVTIAANGFHEVVGDVDAMMQVQALAVEIARGFADFKEFFDLGVVHIEIHSRRAATQRTLRDRQRQGIHHTNEGDDAAGVAIGPDLFTDGAHAAPIGADATAIRGQPNILVPRLHDAIKAIVNRIQEARDGQTALCPAVRQNWGCGHEPQSGDIVIETLGVGDIVSIGGGNAGEHILIAFALQQIAIFQGCLAEIGQERIARPVDLNAFYDPKLNGLRLATMDCTARNCRCCAGDSFHGISGGCIIPVHTSCSQIVTRPVSRPEHPIPQPLNSP